MQWPGFRWDSDGQRGRGLLRGAKPFEGGGTINQQQQERRRVRGIYKDVVLDQPTCGHCDEFTSTLPRQTTSLYHGPVVINLPGRPASWGIARPENLFRPGGTHFISHSICSAPLPSPCLSHHHSLYYLISSGTILGSGLSQKHSHILQKFWSHPDAGIFQRGLDLYEHCMKGSTLQVQVQHTSSEPVRPGGEAEWRQRLDSQR